MKLLQFLAILLSFSIGFSPVAWGACPNTPTSGPTHLYAQFRDLKAVAIAVNGSWTLEQALNCKAGKQQCPVKYEVFNKIYLPAIRTDFIVDLLSKRIRERLFPYLQADENGKIPDLQVFQVSSDGGNVYLKEFMSHPDHLVVSVQTEYSLLKNSGEIYNQELDSSAVAVLTMNVFRSDSFVTYAWGGVGQALQLVIPLDISEDDAKARVERFFERFLYAGPLSDSGHPSRERIDKYEKEVLEKKPPVARITQCQSSKGSE